MLAPGEASVGLLTFSCRADHAASLASRLQAADEKLQRFAEDGGNVPFVSAARYPAKGHERYRSAFSGMALRHPRLSSSADSAFSGGSSSEDESGLPSRVGGIAACDASAELAAAREELQAAVQGLRQIRREAAGRVSGRDTAELYHFFNQAEPPAEDRQVHAPLPLGGAPLHEADCRILSRQHRTRVTLRGLRTSGKAKEVQEW